MKNNFSSYWVALSEFNEHVRKLLSQEKIDELIENLLQSLKSNLDDVLALITEEKRKSSEVRKMSATRKNVEKFCMFF